MSNELGRWVQKELKRRGWNQIQLAELAQITQPNISRVINKTPKYPNEAICGEKVAQGLAQAFGVSPVYVMHMAGILKTSSYNRNFSAWLLGELLRKGLTREELSERSGVELEIITELSQGIPPSLGIVEKLAPVLDIDSLVLQNLAGLVGVEEPSFNQVELDLIQNYRALPSSGQTIIREIMQTLKENIKAFPKE